MSEKRLPPESENMHGALHVRPSEYREPTLESGEPRSIEETESLEMVLEHARDENRTLRSRIESLVGEREELRDGLRVLTTSIIRHEHQCCIGLLEPVLSSREPDPVTGATENSGRVIAPTGFTCPTCGSDDPAKRRPVIDVNPHSVHNDSHICTDTFHSTQRDLEALLAERHSLLTRVSGLEKERDDGVAGVFELLHAAESRIESLVGERDEAAESAKLARTNADDWERAAWKARGEREELLALMEEGYEVLTKMYKPDRLSAWYVKLRSVLSSRERWDNSDERTGRNTDDLSDWPDDSRETTDTDHLSEEERFFGSDGLP